MVYDTYNYSESPIFGYGISFMACKNLLTSGSSVPTEFAFFEVTLLFSLSPIFRNDHLQPNLEWFIFYEESAYICF